MSVTVLENLWPSDFGSPNVVPPVVILRQQATALEENTGRVLRGKVEAIQTDDLSIYYNFYIVAPSLNNYAYNLFWLSHPIDALYPVLLDGREPQLNSPEELKAALKEIFFREKTRNIVQALLAQSMDIAA